MNSDMSFMPIDQTGDDPVPDYNHTRPPSREICGCSSSWVAFAFLALSIVALQLVSHSWISSTFLSAQDAMTSGQRTTIDRTLSEVQGLKQDVQDLKAYLHHTRAAIARLDKSVASLAQQSSKAPLTRRDLEDVVQTVRAEMSRLHKDSTPPMAPAATTPEPTPAPETASPTALPPSSVPTPSPDTAQPTAAPTPEEDTGKEEQQQQQSELVPAGSQKSPNVFYPPAPGAQTVEFVLNSDRTIRAALPFPLPGKLDDLKELLSRTLLHPDNVRHVPPPLANATRVFPHIIHNASEPWPANGLHSGIFGRAHKWDPSLLQVHVPSSSRVVDGKTQHTPSVHVSSDNYDTLVASLTPDHCLHSASPPYFSSLASCSFLVALRPEERVVEGGMFTYLITTNAVASLTHKGRLYKLGFLMDSLREKERLYNSAYGPYGIIVFFGLDDDLFHKISHHVSDIVSTPVVWINVSHFFPPKLPDRPVFRARSPNLTYSWKEQKWGSPCGGGEWTLGYLQMITFRISYVFDEPIYRFYDYTIQVDADARFEIANEDLFLVASKRGKLFGYYECLHDYSCTETLNNRTEVWAQQHGVKWIHKDKVRDYMNYWAGFVLFKTAWFRAVPPIEKLETLSPYDHHLLTEDPKLHPGPLVAEYRAWIDGTAGIYVYRWGEQDIYPLLLAMFTDFDNIFWMGARTAIKHYGSRKDGRNGLCTFPQRANCCYCDPQTDPKCINWHKWRVDNKMEDPFPLPAPTLAPTSPPVALPTTAPAAQQQQLEDQEQEGQQKHDEEHAEVESADAAKDEEHTSGD